MDIVFDLIGEIEINDFNSFDIETSGSNVSGNQNWVTSGLEAIKNVISLLLVQIPMNCWYIMPLSIEITGSILTFTFSVTKNKESLIGSDFFYKFFKSIIFVFLFYHSYVLANVFISN